MRVVFVVILALGTLFALPTHAAMMAFGAQDNIHEIQNISLKDPKGNDLFLGYRTTIVCIVAGVGLVDQGYVLGIRKNTHQYYSLTNEEIKSLQSQKILPLPLPKYSIDFIEYFFGYFLWIVILGIVLYVVLREKSLQRKKKPKFNPIPNLKPTIEMQEYFLKHFPPPKSQRGKR